MRADSREEGKNSRDSVSYSVSGSWVGRIADNKGDVID